MERQRAAAMTALDEPGAENAASMIPRARMEMNVRPDDERTRNEPVAADQPKIERMVPPSARWVTPFMAGLVASWMTPRPCSIGSISFCVRLEGCTSL